MSKDQRSTVARKGSKETPKKTDDGTMTSFKPNDITRAEVLFHDDW
jgi:hypothetical protein